MESFLLGDKGPDVFYEVQEDVVKVLEEKYYPSFLVSEQYKKMQQALLSERADGKRKLDNSSRKKLEFIMISLRQV